MHKFAKKAIACQSENAWNEIYFKNNLFMVNRLRKKLGKYDFLSFSCFFLDAIVYGQFKLFWLFFTLFFLNLFKRYRFEKVFWFYKKVVKLTCTPHKQCHLEKTWKLQKITFPQLFPQAIYREETFLKIHFVQSVFALTDNCFFPEFMHLPLNTVF